MSTSPDFQTILAQLGWTPERAAATLSVSPETISRWLESPEHIPKRTLTVLKKYCQIYHVDAFDSPSDPADATDWAAKEGSSTKIESGALDLRIRDLEEQLRHLRLRHRALIQENAELRQALKEGTPPPPESTLLRCYEILEISPFASWDEVKQNFFRLSKLHHPDRGGDLGKMQAITEAFAQLKIITGQS